MESEERFVGIDVSKTVLDIAVLPDGMQWSLPNTAQGIDELVAALKPLAPALAVLESTGSLHRPVAAGLAAAQLPTAVVNPRRVRDFAKASGRLAKTDRLDAEVIAHFGKAIRPRPTRLPDAATQALEAHLERRRQVVTMITAEKNRLSSAGPQSARTSSATSPGWKRSCTRSTRSCARASARIRHGAHGRICSGASPAWGRCSEPRSWRRSLNSES